MKQLLPKLRRNTAQHTVEYMTVIILIMAGIIIGGPYVIRSWNAQMKSWDDSVIDSFRDPLAEGPPPPIPGCDETSLVSSGCGASAEPCPGMITTCGPYQRISQQNYNPAGCECATIPAPPISVWCTDDPSCCSGWTNVACGVNASPACPDGEMRQNRTCDVTGLETQCVLDALCEYDCLPCFNWPVCNIPPVNSTACSGDTTTGLPGNINWSTTATCSGAKCQAVCNFGFLPQ